MISKLLTKLNSEPNFDITSVTEDNEDYNLFLECDFLRDVKSGKIKTTVGSNHQLWVELTEDVTFLIINNTQEGDFMVQSDGYSSDIEVEECCGVTAFIDSSEVIAVLPTEIVDNLRK